MPMGPGITLPGVTKEQIAEVTECFGKAAARAVQAGFDCVEFHCAHNYLPHSFLSGGINHRTDEYGGSFENRARFPLECIRAIRANIPDGMPLFMRIDAHDDYLENGLTIELTGDIISRPYIDLTLQLMQTFGAKVEWNSERQITVQPGTYLDIHSRSFSVRPLFHLV